MKTEEITALIAAPKCSEVGNSLKGDIVRLMMKIYTLQGKLKEVNIEILKTELNVIAEELAKNIVTRFDGIRISEIEYAFISGLNGEYKVETYGLNYQTFYKWIESYYYSEERKGAISLSIQAKGLKQIEQQCSITEKEKEEIIQMWIHGDFNDYLKSDIEVYQLGGVSLKIGSKDASDERKMNYLKLQNKNLGKNTLMEVYKEYKKMGKKSIFDIK